MDEDSSETYYLEAVKQTLKYHFKDPKTRTSDDTARLVVFLLETLAKEATCRAARVANKSGKSVITQEHVEKILAMLMLDFS